MLIYHFKHSHFFNTLSIEFLDPEQAAKDKEAIMLAEEIIRQRSQGKRPDLLPDYLKELPKTPVDPRPKVGPLSPGYVDPENAYLDMTKSDDYLAPSGDDGGYVTMKDNTSEGLYHELETYVEPDPYA